MMPTQRIRLTEQVTPPERNTTRNALVKFVEGIAPPMLSPTSPVTVPGGSITVDAGDAYLSYVHLLGDEGLTWKYRYTDKRVTRIFGLYQLRTDLGANIHQTTFSGSAEEFPNPADGSKIGRNAYMQCNIFKDTDDTSLVEENNRSVILLGTEIDSANPACKLIVASRNSARTVRFETDRMEFFGTMQINGDPDTIQGSKYSAGSQTSWYNEVNSNQNSITTITDLTGTTMTPTLIDGRKYKCTGEAFFKNAGGATDEIARIFITDEFNGIKREGRTATMPSTNVIGQAHVEWIFRAVGTGVKTFKLRAQRNSGTGSVDLVAGTNGEACWILVEDIGY